MTEQLRKLILLGIGDRDRFCEISLQARADYHQSHGPAPLSQRLVFLHRPARRLE